jgi:hypothetical protein
MRNTLILLHFVFARKGKNINDINGYIVKSDRLLERDDIRFVRTPS